MKGILISGTKTKQSRFEVPDDPSNYNEDLKEICDSNLDN